jgi:hypothetical protein
LLTVDPAAAEVGASPYPTSQAVAADAQFLEYAPPPAHPGVVCLVDSGVDLNPDTLGALVGAEARDPTWGTGDGLAQILPRVDGHPAGHGTEMAMLMAAPENGWGMVGIAPTSVRVYSVRVVPAGQTTFPFANYSYAISRCLQLRIRDQAAVNVINLSIGGTTTPPQPDLADLADSVDTARQHGINVIGAAGNDGASAVSYPAAYQSVLSVSAGDSAPGSVGLRCGFSNSSSSSILAPGCDTAAGGIDEVFEDDGTQAFGYGTSQATALAAAVLSAMRAYAPAISAAEGELCLAASERDSGIMDVARAFNSCGLAGVVRAGLAAIPAPWGPSQDNGASGGSSTSVPPRSPSRLATPRLARPLLRSGQVSIRALNRPRGVLFEVKVLLVRHRKRMVVAAGHGYSDSLTLRVRSATSVEGRFVARGARWQSSRWKTRKIG